MIGTQYTIHLSDLKYLDNCEEIPFIWQIKRLSVLEQNLSVFLKLNIFDNLF